MPSDPAAVKTAIPTPTVSADALRDLVTRLFAANGAKPADAALVSDSLVAAELWGHPSHGTLRAAWYIARLRSGAIRAHAVPRFVVDAGAVAVLDGMEAIGQVLARQAMESAIARARAHGVGVVSVRNANHFGTAMYFTRMAARAGCIGILMANGSPAMAPWGGRRKVIGTNPWSIAAPAGRHPPLVLDIANTATARGKIHVAKRKGAPIPAGWALDADGRPTTDPAAALAGVLLPMAGHKGYGIAVMVDVLSGILAGSSFGSAIHGPYEPTGKSGVGHLAVAMNIAAFRPLPEFEADAERLIAELKSTPLADGFTEVFYPGEPEARSEARLLRDGIPLSAETAGELAGLAKDAGLPTPW